MSKQREKRFNFTEVFEITGVDRTTLLTFIEQNWISPLNMNELDEEDLARIHLIRELETCLEVNSNAVPVILHLVDQLYALRNQLRQEASRQ
jgi:chaperone modulatory protein CbpM